MSFAIESQIFVVVSFRSYDEYIETRNKEQLKLLLHLLILESFRAISEDFKSIFAFKRPTQKPTGYWKYEIYIFWNVSNPRQFSGPATRDNLPATRDNFPATRDTRRLAHPKLIESEYLFPITPTALQQIPCDCSINKIYKWKILGLWLYKFISPLVAIFSEFY